jgi:hypothetical protein
MNLPVDETLYQLGYINGLQAKVLKRLGEFQTYDICWNLSIDSVMSLTAVPTFIKHQCNQ